MSRNVIIVPIYTRGAIDPRHVPIRQGMGGIPHDSILFCEEVSSLDRSLVVDGPYGRPVPEVLLDEVIIGVRRAIGDVV